MNAHFKKLVRRAYYEDFGTDIDSNVFSLMREHDITNTSELEDHENEFSCGEYNALEWALEHVRT